MTISQILDNEETKASEKISQLAEVIEKARKAYGNGEAEISAPKVQTTEGYVDISLLSDDDKLALASTEIRHIITKVTAAAEVTEGLILDRQIEFYLAINPILANITAKVDSQYI